MNNIHTFVVGTQVDVFTGQGWDNWTRFEMKRSKGKVYLVKISGQPLREAEFKQLCEDLK